MDRSNSSFSEALLRKQRSGTTQYLSESQTPALNPQPPISPNESQTRQNLKNMALNAAILHSDDHEENSTDGLSSQLISSKASALTDSDDEDSYGHHRLPVAAGSINSPSHNGMAGDEVSPRRAKSGSRPLQYSSRSPHKPQHSTASSGSMASPPPSNRQSSSSFSRFVSCLTGCLSCFSSSHKYQQAPSDPAVSGRGGRLIPVAVPDSGDYVDNDDFYENYYNDLVAGDADTDLTSKPFPELDDIRKPMRAMAMPSTNPSLRAGTLTPPQLAGTSPYGTSQGTNDHSVVSSSLAVSLSSSVNGASSQRATVSGFLNTPLPLESRIAKVMLSSYGVSSKQGRRAYMEDAYAVFLPYNLHASKNYIPYLSTDDMCKPKRKRALNDYFGQRRRTQATDPSLQPHRCPYASFAVFDGHGGTMCSDYLSQTLLRDLHKSLIGAVTKDMRSAELSTLLAPISFCEENSPADLTIHQHDKNSSLAISHRIRKTFLDNDEIFVRDVIKSSDADGSTACVCMATLANDPAFYAALKNSNAKRVSNDGDSDAFADVDYGFLRISAANVGDTRCILVRFNDEQVLSRNHTSPWADENDENIEGIEVVGLTVDQKASLMRERERIASYGGKVIYTNQWRVAGMLAVGRAFGNISLKRFVKADPEIKEVVLPIQLKSADKHLLQFSAQRIHPSTHPTLERSFVRLPSSAYASSRSADDVSQSVLDGGKGRSDNFSFDEEDSGKNFLKQNQKSNVEVPSTLPPHAELPTEARIRATSENKKDAKCIPVLSKVYQHNIIIIASDGLWDVFSGNDVGSIIAARRQRYLLSSRGKLGRLHDDESKANNKDASAYDARQSDNDSAAGRGQGRIHSKNERLLDDDDAVSLSSVVDESDDSAWSMKHVSKELNDGAIKKGSTDNVSVIAVELDSLHSALFRMRHEHWRQYQEFIKTINSDGNSKASRR